MSGDRLPGARHGRSRAVRPRVLQTFNREPVEIVVQAHDAVAGLRGNDYFPGPRGSGLHHLGEDYVTFLPCDEIPTRKSSVSQVLTGTSESWSFAAVLSERCDTEDGRGVSQAD